MYKNIWFKLHLILGLSAGFILLIVGFTGAMLSFEKENEKWLDFVCACRKGQPLNKEYDIIIGNVADDDVFKTVDMYFRGLWDKEKVLGELRYYKMNNQICIVKQEALDCLLTFQKAYVLVGFSKYQCLI